MDSNFQTSDPMSGCARSLIKNDYYSHSKVIKNNLQNLLCVKHAYFVIIDMLNINVHIVNIF